MEPASIAAAAITAVSAYLLKLGGTAAEEGAKSVGQSAFEWIKDRLPGSDAVVAKMEKTPEAPGPRLALQGQLTMWLEENRDAAAVLRKLLAESAGSSRQSLCLHGDNNTGVNADHGSHVSITR